MIQKKKNNLRLFCKFCIFFINNKTNIEETSVNFCEICGIYHTYKLSLWNLLEEELKKYSQNTFYLNFRFFDKSKYLLENESFRLRKRFLPYFIEKISKWKHKIMLLDKGNLDLEILLDFVFIKVHVTRKPQYFLGRLYHKNLLRSPKFPSVSLLKKNLPEEVSTIYGLSQVPEGVFISCRGLEILIKFEFPTKKYKEKTIKSIFNRRDPHFLLENLIKINFEEAKKFFDPCSSEYLILDSKEILSKPSYNEIINILESKKTVMYIGKKINYGKKY